LPQTPAELDALAPTEAEVQQLAEDAAHLVRRASTALRLAEQRIKATARRQRRSVWSAWLASVVCLLGFVLGAAECALFAVGVAAQAAGGRINRPRVGALAARAASGAYVAAGFVAGAASALWSAASAG
jgi:hypothetical protein